MSAYFDEEAQQGPAHIAAAQDLKKFCDDGNAAACDAFDHVKKQYFLYHEEI